jgi:hypothetical protein
METLTYWILAILAIEILVGLAITLFLRYQLHWWVEEKWLMLKKVISRNHHSGGDT